MFIFMDCCCDLFNTCDLSKVGGIFLKIVEVRRKNCGMDLGVY